MISSLQQKEGSRWEDISISPSQAQQKWNLTTAHYFLDIISRTTEPFYLGYKPKIWQLH